MGIQHDFFDAMTNVIGDEIDQNDIDELTQMIKALPIEQQYAFHASRMFAREAILNDEPRMFHAAFAMLVLSGVGDALLDASQATTVSEIMDVADNAWAATKQIADEAMATIVDKIVEPE